jgi:hypothetical protein
MSAVSHAASRRVIEDRIVVALAGKAAERRANKRDAAGFRPYWERVDLFAIHESGHVCAAIALGQCAQSVTIDKGECRNQVFTDGTNSRGFAVLGPPASPESASPEMGRTEGRSGQETDERAAAGMAYVLSTTGWRGALVIIHEMRTRADILIDGEWQKVTSLAAELRRRGTLNRREILDVLE